MLPKQLDRDEFGTQLNKFVSPARPIQSIEFLQGRSREIERIERAIFAPGRHIFIYGDRGIGKSSLAATAAAQVQSADAPYIDVSCSTDSTFRSVIANVAYQALRISRIYKERLSKSVAGELRLLKVSVGVEVTVSDIHEVVRTVGDAVEVLREVALVHSEKPVVVVDEFDRMASPDERALFAELVKQLGDKAVNVTFFFTGVAISLDQLLGAHPSAIRQFETIELEKLMWSHRWDIAVRAADAFGIEIPENIRIRIAAVSDGYPYYVHLITEKLLWSVWEDGNTITNLDWRHYHTAIKESITSINAELKRPYERAINQRTEDFEDVLWAAADSEYIDRELSQVFSSYNYIMRQLARKGRKVMEYKEFLAVMSKLRGASCGEILVRSRTVQKKGWISYNESMLRGYARMRAEASGIELVGEQEAPKQVMHVPSGGGRYYGSSVPKGVHGGRMRRVEKANSNEEDDQE